MTSTDKGLVCKHCGKSIEFDNISPANLQFVGERIKDNTLDHALTLSRIAWTQFPDLKISEQSRTIVEIMMKKVEEKVGNVLAPIQTATSTLVGLSGSINAVAQQLPENVKKQIEEKMTQINQDLKTLQDITSKCTVPVTDQITALRDSLNTLMLKPNAKGQFGENTIADVWQATFAKDEITQLGGPGKPDLMVIPHLGTRAGEKISIERKFGQNYSKAHVNEALRHAHDYSAKYAMVLYDNPEKLPDPIGLLSIDTDEGVMTIVTDVQQGWKIGRYIISGYQLTAKPDVSLQGVDLKELQAIVREMNDYQEKIDTLRKKHAKSSKDITLLINALEQDFGKYLDRLQLALNPARQGGN